MGISSGAGLTWKDVAEGWAEGVTALMTADVETAQLDETIARSPMGVTTVFAKYSHRQAYPL